jgi:hypothetical protein
MIAQVRHGGYAWSGARCALVGLVAISARPADQWGAMQHCSLADRSPALAVLTAQPSGVRSATAQIASPPLVAEGEEHPLALAVRDWDGEMLPGAPLGEFDQQEVATQQAMDRRAQHRWDALMQADMMVPWCAGRIGGWHRRCGSYHR